jgi:hypothetical protein
MHKENVVHVHNGILFTYKRMKFCDNMDRTRHYYVKGDKPGTEKTNAHAIHVCEI